MKQVLILLLLIASPLAAKPYLSEHHGSYYVTIFQGEIKDSDEAKVRALQTQYLESLHHPYHPNRAHQFEYELNQLGVTVTSVEANPYIHSEQATPYFTPSVPSTPAAPTAPSHKSSDGS
ncbi:hypothetical protein ACFLR2_00625 [Chlamydiota bacterium]